MKINILNKISLFLKKQIKKITWKDYLIIFLGITAICFYFSSRYYYDKSLNPIIVSDSTYNYTNKNDEEYVAKDIYVTTKKELEELNKELYNELKSLKDNPDVITKVKIVTKIDSIKTIPDTIIKQVSLKDTTYNLLWHATESNNYYSINGYTNVKNDFTNFETQINELSIPSNLTIDIIDDNEKIKIIGKTDNPYINIINIDGVVVDPSKSKVLKKYYNQKKFNIGPTIGVGVTNDLKVKPYFGIGISYGILQF